MELAPGEPLMSRDNLDAMSVDNVASGALPDLEALGIRPASVHRIAPTYLRGIARSNLPIRGHAEATRRKPQKLNTLQRRDLRRNPLRCDPSELHAPLQAQGSSGAC